MAMVWSGLCLVTVDTSWCRGSDVLVQELFALVSPGGLVVMFRRFRL